MGSRASSLLLFLLLFQGASASEPGGPRGETPQQQLLELRAPTVVRVEVVLKTEVNVGGQGQQQESRLDVLGSVVNPRGLIMLWNSHISSSRMKDVMDDMGGGGSFQLDVTPTDFKVRFEAGDREMRGFLAATDSILDLAFVQVEGPVESDLAAVSFENGAVPQVGQEVASVGRLGRSFDFAPYLETARIGGVLNKPRRAWIVDGVLSGFGLPVFSLDGQVVGVLTTVYSQAAEVDAGDSFGFGGFFSGLMMNRGNLGPLGAFVLPADRTAVLVRQAAERAAELLARRTPAFPPATHE